ncbi:MAG: XdhC family protein [Alphaproteobacteria bacterium]|nr:XdhC family protein [Alphaproteobacteria bacterium]
MSIALTNQQILAQAMTWFREGHNVKLATVIKTWGSAPRPAGSLMAIKLPMDIVGSVSGGCVENDVVMQAAHLGENEVILADYGVSDEQAFAVGLACGGSITVSIQNFPGDAFPAEVGHRQSHGFLVQNIQDGALQYVSLKDAKQHKWYKEQQEEPWMYPDTDHSIFVNPMFPPLRIVIIGAVHTAQYLANLAHTIGYDTDIIDPREAFLDKDRFPDSNLINGWPDEVLTSDYLDRSSCVVSLTHDEKIDDPGLQAALRSDVFYIGALGSRKTHAKRCERLQQQGFGEEDLQRIHAPVGLNIGSRGPGEIALSILAQITQSWRTKS